MMTSLEDPLPRALPFFVKGYLSIPQLQFLSPLNQMALASLLCPVCYSSYSFPSSLISFYSRSTPHSSNKAAVV